jgi:AcrR family transcriptional regulator
MSKHLALRRRPKQPRSAATVDSILEASRRVLVREGYEGFTTKRVAEVAGVGIGSLYEYFPTKDALLAGLVDRFLEGMLAAVIHALTGGESLEMGVDRVIGALLETKARHAELNAVILEQLPRVDGAARLEAFNRTIQPFFAAYLAKFAGELSSVELERAAFVLIYAVEGVMTEMVKRQTVMEARMKDELVTLVLGFLRARR